VSSAFKETFFGRFRRRTPRGSVAEGGRQKQPGEIGGNTISRIFFLLFCGRKSNRTRGDGARRERTHQSRFMVFQRLAQLTQSLWPLHTDFGGHFQSNERQICKNYWRICQSDFEFLEKRLFFIHSLTGDYLETKYLLVILEQKTAMRISCHGNQKMMRSCLLFKIS
jgi:hypothetical protein